MSERAAANGIPPGPGRPGGPEDPVVLATADDAGCRLLLRRVGETVELLVDGVFAIDSGHQAAERSLAAVALSTSSGSQLRITLAGLGLGYTAATLLQDPRVRSLEIVELHACLPRWLRQGLVPGMEELLDDPRVRVRIGNALDVVPELPRGGTDALLLDVDNGPSFLTHPGNTAVYSAAFLTAAARAVRRGGVLGVWAAEPAAELAVMLERSCGDCTENLLQVTRDGRTFTYAVYLARVLR